MASNAEVVSAFYRRLDAGDLSAFDEMCTSSFVSHFQGVDGVQTRDERKRTSAAFYDALTDLQHTLEKVVDQGTDCAVLLSVSGTHEGRLMGYEPTGKRVTFGATRFYRIEDGLLAEEWVTYDSAGLLRQLGATLG